MFSSFSLILFRCTVLVWDSLLVLNELTSKSTLQSVSEIVHFAHTSVQESPVETRTISFQDTVSGKDFSPVFMSWIKYYSLIHIWSYNIGVTKLKSIKLTIDHIVNGIAWIFGTGISIDSIFKFILIPGWWESTDIFKVVVFLLESGSHQSKSITELDGGILIQIGVVEHITEVGFELEIVD